MIAGFFAVKFIVADVKHELDSSWYWTRIVMKNAFSEDQELVFCCENLYKITKIISRSINCYCDFIRYHKVLGHLIIFMNDHMIFPNCV